MCFLHPLMATTFAQNLIILYLDYFQNQLPLPPSCPWCTWHAKLSIMSPSPLLPYMNPLPTRKVSSLSLPETQSFCSDQSLGCLFSSLSEYSDLPPTLGWAKVSPSLPGLPGTPAAPQNPLLLSAPVELFSGIPHVYIKEAHVYIKYMPTFTVTMLGVGG